jgi:hypothetical protein
MLVAASEWEADLQMEVKDNFAVTSHFRVITMDSSFMHTRSLYEFFIDTGLRVRNDTANAKRDFGVSIAPTAAYIKWIDALNKRVFHLDIYRPKPQKNSVVIPGVKIKNEVTHLAQDVLDLWDLFTSQTPMYARLLRSRRSMAIKNATEAAQSRGINTPVFK